MTTPYHRRWRALAVSVTVLLTAAACRDTAVVAGPPTESSPPCTSADCATFRSVSATAEAGLVQQSTAIAGNLRDAATSASLRERLATLQRAVAENRTEAVRINLLGALAYIDRGMSDPSRRSDLADLSAIRLNLEPLVVKYGLR